MKKTYLIGLIAVFLVILTGCHSSQTKTSSKQLNIVVSFYPMEQLTKAVTGDQAKITTLVPSNVEVHEYEPTASDMAKIQKSDLVIYNSNNLEKWLDKSNKTIQAAKGIKMITNNPHTWLSPKNAIIEVENIESALSKKYPKRAQSFHKNAKAYIAKLKKIDQSYSTFFKSAKQKNFVTQHGAFEYMARDYGLTAYELLKYSPEGEPSTSGIAKLTNIIKEKQITGIYAEENENEASMKALAKEADVPVYKINTAESITKKEKKDGLNLLKIYRNNLTALKKTME